MSYLPILTYHRLLAEEPNRRVDPMRISVSREQFRRHLAWLKRLGFSTLALNDYVAELRDAPGGIRRTHGRTFAITFDDGYEEVLSLGLPILQEFGFHATVFAVPGLDRNRWDNGDARLMGAEELRSWHRAGMGVGAHTSHHVHLTQLDVAQARTELTESKARLEDMLGKAVTLLAYPYGESNEHVEQWAREAGFEAAFATDRAPADHAENRYRLRRAVVFPRNTAWEILIKAQRWYPRYQDFKRRNR